MLGKATAAFLDVLDAVTLEQMVLKEERKRSAPRTPSRGGSATVQLHFKKSASTLA